MANVPCPHCGQSIDMMQLVYANAIAKEAERAEAQAQFDKDIAEGRRNGDGRERK